MRTLSLPVCALLFLALAPGFAGAQVLNLHATFGDDPMTQVTVSWAGGTSSAVAYGTTLAMTQSTTGTQTGVHHNALLSGLMPGTTYYYEVGGDPLGTGTFVTAPSGAPGFVFAVPGDVQDRNFSPEWRDQGAFFVTMGAAFQIPVGDLVQEGQEQAQWDVSFYGSAPGFMEEVILMPVRGNHETYSLTNPVNECNGLFMEQFRFPNNPVDASYSFEYGDALFIAIDSFCSDTATELAWLEGVLQNNTKTWIFAFLHRPVYSTGGHGGADLMGSYNALFEAYDVNAVFSGHTHSMSVNHPIHDNLIVPSYADGVLYFNTAGTNYNSDRDDAVSAKPFQSYLQPGDRLPMATLVTVGTHEAVVDTYNYLTGATYHTVTIPTRTSRPAGTVNPVPSVSSEGLWGLTLLFALLAVIMTGMGRRAMREG